jgi:hypothetical protein
MAGSLVFEGLAGSTPFSIGLTPSVVVIPQDMLVDADAWVLVLEGHTLLTGRLPNAPEGLAVAPGAPLADTLTVALPDALWLGKVSDARDHLQVDLWPFPDVTFDGDSASLTVSTGGCSDGGDAELPDADLDGIPDLDDDDPQTPGTPSGGDGGSSSGDADRCAVTCAASPLLPIACRTFVFSAVRRRGPRPG